MNIIIIMYSQNDISDSKSFKIILKSIILCIIAAEYAFSIIEWTKTNEIIIMGIVSTSFLLLVGSLVLLRWLSKNSNESKRDIIDFLFFIGTEGFLFTIKFIPFRVISIVISISILFVITLLMYKVGFSSYDKNNRKINRFFLFIISPYFLISIILGNIFPEYIILLTVVTWFLTINAVILLSRYYYFKYEKEEKKKLIIKTTIIGILGITAVILFNIIAQIYIQFY